MVSCMQLQCVHTHGALQEVAHVMVHCMSMYIQYVCVMCSYDVILTILGMCVRTYVCT